MVAEWACDDDCFCVLAAAVCAAEGGGAVVPRCGRFAVARDVSLAGGEGEGCAGDCDCARPGGLLRFELRAGDCGKGVPTRVSCGAAEPAELWRLGKAYAHAVQLRAERGLPGGAGGIGERRRVQPSFLCGIFDGREFSDEDGGGVWGRSAESAEGSVRDLSGN